MSREELFSGPMELRSGAEVYGKDYPGDVSYKIRPGQTIGVEVSKGRGEDGENSSSS